MSQKRFHDPTSRFPPQDPGRSGSPASSVLPGCYDILPSVSPHFVSFAWRYPGCIVRSLLAARDAKAAGPVRFALQQAPPYRLDCRGKDRTSQVPARPQYPVCTCSSTPAEPIATRR